MSERKGTKGLELWCRKMTEGYPGVKVDNMTTSWRDGLAFCAIIHHFRPDLIEFDKLNKDDIYHNNELAFRVAEHHLGIPALLEPEDMVEYEVPDRLSILTYLSQFYQTFENQRGKSGARIAPKRTQSTPDHGIVSPASTSPPTKVQITVGRARREPCAKCGLPVFIAERLNVGKLLYHRTCFRCARCSSQLTLANYYETENAEFCCEICPDEEKKISKKVSPESVLSRSLSDEEKTASLQTYAEAPDAYSTHFETALEFSIDADLKKHSTLTGAESTEFTKARSHFFNSQMENLSKSSSEDIPVELPKSNSPPLLKSQYDGEDIPFDLFKPKPFILDKPDSTRASSDIYSDNSSFPSEKKDTDIVSSSVSEQTNDRFVTKDNTSSSSRVSVRARMKLFENNEDNKSDVNKFFSSTNPASLGLTKKKATVVAIDDLEDFDNISRKDIDIGDSLIKNGNSQVTVLSDEEENESDIKRVTADNSKKSALDVSNKANNLTVSATNTLFYSAEHKEMISPHLIDDSVVEIVDSSQEAEGSHITIDSDREEVTHKEDISCITIDDSPEVPLRDNVISKLPISDDSFQTAESAVSPASITSGDFIAPGRGYYTAYEMSSPQDDGAIVENERAAKPDLSDAGKDHNVFNNEALVKQDTLALDNNETNILNESYVPTSEVTDDNETKNDTRAPILLDDEGDIDKHKLQNCSEIKDEVNAINPDEDYPDYLNPFGDDDLTASPPEMLDDKVTTSIKPLPAARPKKKIIPPMELRELTGTPECLNRVYTERISVNPFECDDSDDDNGNSSYNPFEETKGEEEPVAVKLKKKIVPSLEVRTVSDTPERWSNVPPKGYNPFEDDEDEGGEEPVKPVPIPTPRTSKANRPEPKPRDTLSITSRGSHGGSNSSISSGSAFGSARKKKPAPRPPIPFRNNDSPSTPGSLLASPSQSVIQSPNLSGTIRSRKTKRAPLPPCASTPFDPDRKPFNDRVPGTLGVSPVTLDRAEALSDAIQKEKTVKDEENRTRQNQILSSPNEMDSNLRDKSTAGRWKRRKGQAPSRPIPERRIVKTLPISEIKRELDTIEIQQQGLEKQGVRLEQIIREKCEGTEGSNTEEHVPIEVEDLILQLFELVNEKNELFRRQAELMYLRRQQRLEEEYADVEYQIRCLMLQPEANKSDSDKVREETLINRLVEIVERRNEIIECLEMDRKREAEEDDSISSQLNLYSSKRDADKEPLKEEEKKDKKKKHKKLNKIIHTFKHKKEKDHKVDIDKDVDETELNSSSEKKKKKFNLFLH